MTNQVIVVGRLAEDIKIGKDEKNIEIATIKINRALSDLPAVGTTG